MDDVEGKTIEVIWKEFVDLIVAMFRGQNIIFVASVVGIVGGIYVKIKNIVLKKQKEMIEAETKKINDEQTQRLDQQDIFIAQMFEKLDGVNLNVVRMQILMGIQQESLSKSELMYFYDKYTALGGNSFVSTKVNAYLEREDIK